MIKQLPVFRDINIESRRGDMCGSRVLNLLTRPFLNRIGSAPPITNFDKSCPADRGGRRAGQSGPLQLTQRHANNLGQQGGVDWSDGKIDLPIYCQSLSLFLALSFSVSLSFTLSPPYTHTRTHFPRHVCRLSHALNLFSLALMCSLSFCPSLSVPPLSLMLSHALSFMLSLSCSLSLSLKLSLSRSSSLAQALSLGVSLVSLVLFQCLSLSPSPL